jgi:catechol 2,3-dioxygenase-like lactoylglutathione lyase family enzyme
MMMVPTTDSRVNGRKDVRLTRRELMLALSALALTPMRGAAQSGAPSVPVRTLNHVHLNVSDLRRSLEFYQSLFGMRLQGNQGVEADWSRGVVPILGIGDGPHFISFAERADPGPRGGIEANIRIRADANPPVPELKFNDPDGVILQIQDVSYCGGSGALGSICPSQPAAVSSPIPARSLNHVHLPVADVSRSRAFYRRVLGMRTQAEQGIESDWTTPIIFMLGIGPGPAFISFSPGQRTGVIDHFCFGVENFDAEQVAEILVEHGLEPNIRMRADSTPPVPELKFNDPDGIIVQIQDVSYCGGSGVLGDACAPLA